ncbi:MAG: DegT/DnrJ/EryC1/StrS family aminotransferase [bacterium]|nr:DegT/DnrJ/EryC1/StrS family aminotransferase [bacterium]
MTSPSIDPREEKPALLGGGPGVRAPLPAWPQHTELELEFLKQTLESGSWWRMTGRQLKQFEADFARYHGARFGLAVTNGTHALELALRVLDVGPGDEVIVPAMTFIATAMPPFTLRARAVPVDVLEDTWCLDPKAMEAAIGPRTRAVIPVHFAGQGADMTALLRLGDAHSIPVIEDAAHAHGGRWNGRPVGSFGRMAAYSFQNFKLLTAGEGGMLLFHDEADFEKATLLANCGRAPQDTRYEHTLLGSNYRISEFQGAVLNAQLSRLGEQGERREANAAQLDRHLEQIEGVYPQQRDPRTDRHAYYMYVFTYRPEAFNGIDRSLFVRALVAEGVPAFRMYPRVQDTEFFAAAWEQTGGDSTQLPDCPVSRQQADLGIWIHHRALLGDAALVEQVAGAIAKIRRCSARLADRRC